MGGDGGKGGRGGDGAKGGNGGHLILLHHKPLGFSDLKFELHAPLGVGGDPGNEGPGGIQARVEDRAVREAVKLRAPSGRGEAPALTVTPIPTKEQMGITMETLRATKSKTQAVATIKPRVGNRGHSEGEA
jgi:hypothetical protein